MPNSLGVQSSHERNNHGAHNRAKPKTSPPHAVKFDIIPAFDAEAEKVIKLNRRRIVESFLLDTCNVAAFVQRKQRFFGDFAVDETLTDNFFGAQVFLREQTQRAVESVAEFNLKVHDKAPFRRAVNA